MQQSSFPFKPLDVKGKACLFNLVIYTQEKRRLEYFQELVKCVVDKFPCRVIFIQGSLDSKESFLKTSLTSICTGSIDCSLTLDQLFIEASNDRLQEVPFLVLPQLAPDLPVYLLWGQNPTKENQILPHLEKYATRIIFDSECTDDLALFSHQLLLKMRALNCDLVDMNWARFQGWRYALSQVFDTPAKLGHLKLAKEIKVLFNSQATEAFHHQEIQALYLQAWLATQLGWTFHSTSHQPGKIIHIFSAQHHQIPIEITSCSSDQFGVGSLVSISITGSNDHHFEFVRKESQPQNILVTLTTHNTCDIPYIIPLPNRTHNFAFIREILYAPISGHYAAMLQTISQNKACVAGA